MKIGIDLGGSHIGIALINDENEILEKFEMDIEKKENLESEILEIIDFYISKFKQNNNIELIGIASPGNPKVNDLTISNLVNLGIEKLELKSILEKHNIPIKLKNDSKAAGLAEFKYGSLKEYNDAVFLCLGTGIGSAVFLNGKLLQANKHIGFELGHIVIDRNGEQCNCGKKGCFETYCAMKRFKEKAKKLLNIDNITSEELLEEIKRNKDSYEIKKLIDEYIDNLIIGLSNVIDVFELEAISFGGSFVYFKDLFYEKLVTEMKKRKYTFNKDDIPKILLAELKNDAGMIGAIL